MKLEVPEAVPGARHLSALPLFHVAGLANLSYTLFTGGHLHLLASFDPAGFVDELVRRRIQLTQLVPTLIHAVTQEVSSRAEPPDLSHLIEVGLRRLADPARPAGAGGRRARLPVPAELREQRDRPAADHLAAAGGPRPGARAPGYRGTAVAGLGGSAGGARRDPGARRRAAARLLERPGGHRQVADRRRLLPHRRRRHHRRRRLPDDRRPAQRPGHHRRRERLPGRGGGGAGRASRGRRRRGHRRPRRAVGRDRARRRRAGPGRMRRRRARVRHGRPGQLGARAAGRVQVPDGVTVVSELPRNATGKVLRAALRQPFWADRDRLVS